MYRAPSSEQHFYREPSDRNQSNEELGAQLHSQIAELSSEHRFNKKINHSLYMKVYIVTV